MKINLTKIFGFKLQLTAFFMDYKTGKFTLLGLDLIKKLESLKKE